MGARHILTELDRSRLNADFAERDRLREIMAANTYDIINLELGVSKTAMLRMEQYGFDHRRFRCVERDTINEIQRRRTLYWLTREQYDPKYSDRALMPDTTFPNQHCCAGTRSTGTACSKRGWWHE